MIKCPNCGAELKYDAKTKLVNCEYCNSKFEPTELKEKLNISEKVENTYEGKAYLCSQCGAKLLTFDETAITFCSYCGSQAMVEQEMIKQKAPDYIIPFKKTKDECIESYKKVLSKSLFAPRYMKSDIVVNKFRGIYIPYCIYKASCHGPQVNKGSKYSHRSGDYQYYNDYSITADVDAEYNGISYDLISNFYDKFSHALPHNFKEIEQFNPNYLTGFYADKGDVEDYLYESEAEKLAERDSTNYLSKIKTFRIYGCSNPHAHFTISEKKLGMFPIYFLAIRNKKNTYVNYAVINGQTGKAAVDLPVDFKKYIFASLILTIFIFLIINNLLALTPKKICLFSILFSIVSLIISISQVKKINDREQHLDDIGYSNKNIGEEQTLDIKTSKPKKSIGIKNVYKQIIGFLIGVSVLILNFVNDIYYYGACIVIFILVIMSFYNLVNQHNRLVSTKLPQLEKRGGDESE